MENRKDPMYRTRLKERVAEAFTPDVMRKLSEKDRFSLSEEEILEVVRSEWGGSILSSVIPLDLEEREIISLSRDIHRIVLESNRYSYKILQFYIDISPLDEEMSTSLSLYTQILGEDESESIGEVGDLEIGDSLKRRIEWKPTN